MNVLNVLNVLNILDWVIIGLFLVGVILGFLRGFISQLVSIVGLFISYIAAYWFYDDLAPWIAKWVPLTQWESYEKYQSILSMFKLDVYFYNAVAFALIFFAVKIGLSVIGHLLNLIVKVPGLNFINKWSGALLASLEVIILVIIGVNVMSIIPSDGVQSLVNESQIAMFIIEKIPMVAEKLHELWSPQGQ